MTACEQVNHLGI